MLKVRHGKACRAPFQHAVGERTELRRLVRVSGDPSECRRGVRLVA
jgi:hypothetical protein